MEFAGIHSPFPLFLAPMAGVSDRPFRQLCKSLGADYAVSEMVTSNALLYGSTKTRRRANHAGERGPVIVQIAGSDPSMMAEAARHNVERGAQVIDINMGCPVRKVCNVAAGSALLRDETLVARILEAVVAAVPQVPVTLKTRTGWDHDSRNAVAIARIAEASGIRLLTIHGRTRADLYMGEAEYDTIAEVCAAVHLPVIANGDINSPHKARKVLAHTGAAGLMIGRAAQGRPWIFREISHYLETGETPSPMVPDEIAAICTRHILELHAFYGEEAGVRVARKHIGWYAAGYVGAHAFRQQINRIEETGAQLAAIREFFGQMTQLHHAMAGVHYNQSEKEILAA